MHLTIVPGIPMVEPGDDIAELILQALKQARESLHDGDVLVIAQKIISKAEGRYAYLKQVTPSSEAMALARKIHKDPRLVELILAESKEVLRSRPGVVIVEHRLGYVHANAGIDKSNIESDNDNPRVLLLPLDSNASASMLRAQFKQRLGLEIKLIINDSAGRAWRNGSVGFTLGCAGFEPIVDMIGRDDLFGRPMEVTTVAVADELAGAASFMMGQGDEASPVVLIRGARLIAGEKNADVMIRAKQDDLFR